MKNSWCKQYDTNHITNRLYVHWDVSTQCQFKCTYCYAMKEYGWKDATNPGDWGKIDSWEKQRIVINSIKRSGLPVFLGLLGGEPTIHPRYRDLIDLCYDAIDVHDLGRLYITTNGLKGPDFFDKHYREEHTKMLYLWSFHPEKYESYGDNFYKILDSIKLVLQRGSRCRLNVMLHDDRELWPVLHKLVDLAEQIEGLEIHPHWIYSEGDPTAGVIDYDEEFYNEFSRFKNYPAWLNFENEDGSVDTLNDYSIFTGDNYNFCGWKCWHNNYEISWNGVVHKVCFPEPSVNLIHDPFFFKKLTEIKPVICPHSSCTCDGQMKIYKER